MSVELGDAELQIEWWVTHLCSRREKKKKREHGAWWGTLHQVGPLVALITRTCIYFADNFYLQWYITGMIRLQWAARPQTSLMENKRQRQNRRHLNNEYITGIIDALMQNIMGADSCREASASPLHTSPALRPSRGYFSGGIWDIMIRQRDLLGQEEQVVQRSRGLIYGQDKWCGGCLPM